MILAGDVGGTKTVLALFEERRGGFEIVRDVTEPSREFPSLDGMIRRFLDSPPAPKIAAACFGVAGAVIDGRCVTTNLPWTVDEKALVETVPTPRVKLLNDLEAAAWGVMNLPAEELATLQAGNRRRGNMVLIAAGTGLGEALIVWEGSHPHVIASEGGHADFAPRTERETQLLTFLRREFGHVSYERVLSGPGCSTAVSSGPSATRGASRRSWSQSRCTWRSTPASLSSARRWWRPRCTARASPCHPGAQRPPREGALQIDCSRLGGTGGRSQSDERAVRVPSFDQIDSVVSRAVTKGPSGRSRSAIFALSALPRSR